MQKINWKSIAFTTIVSAVAVMSPSLASANWSVYKLNEIAGDGHYADAALGVNAYNAIAGMGFNGTSTMSYTGITGGPNTNTSFFSPPSNWNAIQWNELNDDGITVGYYTIGGVETAVRYQPGSSPNNLVAGLSQVLVSNGVGINHNGMVVGSYRQNGNNGGTFHMFRWDPSSKTRTGDWLNYIPGGINENGWMAAQNIKPTNYYQLLELALVPPTGSPTIVTAPGFYTYMQPSSISTGSGIIVVGDMHSYIQNNSDTYASGFVYSKATNTWQMLNGPGGNPIETHALAVDQGGTRVAGYTADNVGNQTAAVWEYTGGQWVETDVPSLVPSDSTWRYDEATSISPTGSISGWGMHHEGDLWVQRAFVLTPTDQLRISAVEGGIFAGDIVSPTVSMMSSDVFTLDVNLGSSSRIVKVPGGIRIPGGQTSAKFNLQSDGVDSRTTVEITASLGGADFVQQYLLLPAVFSAMTLQPDSRDAGGTGTLTLRGLAGPSGVVVNLTSSDRRVSVPSSVKIGYDQGGTSFSIRGSSDIPKGTVVTITATYGNVTISQPYTVA